MYNKLVVKIRIQPWIGEKGGWGNKKYVSDICNVSACGKVWNQGQSPTAFLNKFGQDFKVCILEEISWKFHARACPFQFQVHRLPAQILASFVQWFKLKFKESFANCILKKLAQKGIMALKQIFHLFFL